MVRGFNLDLSSIAAPMCRLAEVDMKSSIAAIQLEMKGVIHTTNTTARSWRHHTVHKCWFFGTKKTKLNSTLGFLPSFDLEWLAAKERWGMCSFRFPSHTHQKATKVFGLMIETCESMSCNIIMMLFELIGICQSFLACKLHPKFFFVNWCDRCFFHETWR
ncbi:unnamed protein product [Musa banksii]